MHRRQFLSSAGLLAIIGGSALATYEFGKPAELIAPQPAPALLAGNSGGNTGYRFQRLASPNRTIVLDTSGTQLATFTDGSRTAVFSGPVRTFSDPHCTAATVTSSALVHIAPRGWALGSESAPWFLPWFSVASASHDDVLGMAMQYLNSAPTQDDSAHIRIAGDAGYSPGNTDFYDYLGVDWTFPDGTRRSHNPAHYGTIDSAGFVRLVYGYRCGFPLLANDKSGSGLPRSASAMAATGPGTTIIKDTGARATAYSALQPGDLLFFDLHPKSSYAGIYLGVDNTGAHRMLSSRRAANGPTFGDLGGTSAIDRPGTYSLTFRSAKRL